MTPIEAWLAWAPEFSRQMNRPLVTISYAQSLDGSLAARAGEPLAISGAEAVRMTHALRAAHDSILVGIGTVLADDPQLTVRFVDGQQPQPVVLDSRLRTPTTARLLEHPRGAWIAVGEGASAERQAALRAKGAQILLLPLDSYRQVDLVCFLTELTKRRISSLMVEGGSGVISSFLRQRLVDQFVITIAPRLVCGVHLETKNQIDGWNCSLTDVGYVRLGDDLIVYGRPRWG